MSKWSIVEYVAAYPEARRGDECIQQKVGIDRRASRSGRPGGPSLPKMPRGSFAEGSSADEVKTE